MIDIFDLIEEYLYIFLFILPFFTQLGIPLGLTFFAMFYGSSISSFSFFILDIFILAFTLLLADLIAYSIGRKYGKNIFTFFSKNKVIKNKVKQVSSMTNNNSFLAIFLTRTILLGLSPITNYLFGFEKYSLKKFIIFVFLAEIIFSFIFIGIGYFFSETWELILNLIEDFSYIFLSLILVYYLIKYLIKYLFR